MNCPAFLEPGTTVEGHLSFVRVMFDGRTADRYVITLPVEVMSGEAGASQAMMRNISSQGGVFLRVRNDVVTDAEIQFAVLLPEQLTHREDMRVECKATVVRVQRDADDALVGVAAKITSLRLTASQKAEA